jgi:uncharacterized repeat protein (TIGR01451 family)
MNQLISGASEPLMSKHLLAANNSIPNRYGRLLGSLALSLCALSSWMQPVNAEGSRTLYPSTAPAGSTRANLEWRTDFYGNLVKRRTLLKVYANQGEYILLGSSAVGQGSGDILVYNPNTVTGNVGDENIPGTPDFKCSTQPGKGYISSRAMELAGPKSFDGTANTTGYIPCYYQAPSTGVYNVVMYGPTGENSSANGGPTGDLVMGSSNNFNSVQGTTVAAWDVTVRSSDPKSTTDINGRLFSYYLALFTGTNGLPLNFPIYPITTDGYKYKVELRGLDPNAFVIFGNQVGFFDSDGKTPLYHDIIGKDGQINNPEGSTKLARPQYATFFNLIDPTVLPYIDRYATDGRYDGTGIPSSPPVPNVNDVKFAGTAGANNSSLGTGGTFTFNSGVEGNYEIVISLDGVDYDPTSNKNRSLRGIMTAAGVQSVYWNGKDNSGNNFPVGTNYKVRVKVHSGEYHFPLLDAENNFTGGPTITMLNGTNPLGNTTAFYDDRGYRTIDGNTVGTTNTVLCGIGQPSPAFSNTITGFNTATNDRKFGQSGNNGNANTQCNGSFGDTKGLDIWTYFPGSAEDSQLNIIDSKLTISGTLYKDNNGNSKFDSAEPTLPAGITVKLINPTDNSVIATTTTNEYGAYIFTAVTSNTNYKIQIDPNDSKIPTGFFLSTPNNLAVSVTKDSLSNENFGFNAYKVSLDAGKVIINEVLYKETVTGATADTNDEFIEIYNASNSIANLSYWKLMDGNLIQNNIDGINGIDSITGKSSPYLFPNGTTLAPGKYAVIWIGNNNANHQSPKATVQAWLGQTPKLNNDGDDIWLYDNQNQIVDYIAYGLANDINTPPPTSLNLWNSTYQSALAGAVSGQSISLTKNGLDGNNSACWETTTSGSAKTQGCTNYLPTRNTDTTGKYKTSVGANNNDPAKLVLVKRITKINGTDVNQYVDDTTSANKDDDNNPNWSTPQDPGSGISTFLRGAINGGKVKPGDELEYTIYFLSSGGGAIKNVNICDLVPENSSFVDNAFASGSGIALNISSTTNLTNVNDSDRGQYLAPGTAPAACNKVDILNGVTPPNPLSAAQNTTGAVLVNVISGSTTLPDAAPGSSAYGFIRFHVKIK